MRKLFNFLLSFFPHEYQHAWALYNNLPIETIATIEIRECRFEDSVHFVIPKGVDSVYIFALDCILPNNVKLTAASQALYPSCILNMNEIPIHLDFKGHSHAERYFVGLQHYMNVAIALDNKRFHYCGHQFGQENAQALIDYAKARGLMTH